MYVYYYIIEGIVRITCCRGLVPGRLSPVWTSPSACAWLIPGTAREQDDEMESIFHDEVHRD